MKFIPQRLLLCIAVVFYSASLVADAQQCSNGDFIVTNGQEILLKITAANEVFTCGSVNICDKINQGQQTMSLAADGATLSISSGNSITLPDSSATNEIQTLSLTSGVLAISGGNSVELPDVSATNEIQSLSLSNTGVLSISSSNDVQLPDVSATNELQTLSVTSGQLSIASGNTVDLSGLKTYLKFLGFSASVPAGTVMTPGATLLPFSVVDWITFPVSSFSTVTGAFTVPLAGYYRLSLRAYSPTASTNSDRVSFWWRVNGVFGYQGICGGQFSAGDSPFPACNYIAKLNASDVVQAVVYTPLTMTLGTNPGTECQWQTEFLGPQ